MREPGDRESRLRHVLPGCLVVLVVAGCLPTSVTDQGRVVNDLWNVFIVPAIAVAAIVWGLITIAILRFRRRASTPAEPPPQVAGHTGLEIVWTVIPIADRRGPVHPDGRGREPDLRTHRWRDRGQRHGVPLAMAGRLSCRRRDGRGPGRCPGGDGRACRRARARDAHLARRRPLVLCADLPVQARRDPGTPQHLRVHGRGGGDVSRPVRRVLRRQPRPHDLLGQSGPSVPITRRGCPIGRPGPRCRGRRSEHDRRAPRRRGDRTGRRGGPRPHRLADHDRP